MKYFLVIVFTLLVISHSASVVERRKFNERERERERERDLDL